MCTVLGMLLYVSFIFIFMFMRSLYCDDYQEFCSFGNRHVLIIYKSMPWHVNIVTFSQKCRMLHFLETFKGNNVFFVCRKLTVVWVFYAKSLVNLYVIDSIRINSWQKQIIVSTVAINFHSSTLELHLTLVIFDASWGKIRDEHIFSMIWFINRD